MSDQDEAKKQLLAELAALRQRVADLEALEAKRRQTEEALRQEHDLVARIVETHPLDIVVDKEGRDRAQKYLDVAGVMLVALDEQGTITLMNRMGHTILGYEEGDLLGRNWFDTCLPVRIREQVRTVFQSLMSGETEPVAFFENPVLTKTGQERMIAWRNTILTDGSDRIVGTLSSGEDITERQRMEAALRDSEAKHRHIVESIPVGMHLYELTPGGQLVFVGANPAADLILGVDSRQFVGQTIEQAFPPLVGTEVPEQYRRVASAGGTWYIDQLQYAEGEITGVFEVHAFQTAPGRMTAAFLDVTDRKRAEEALHQRTRQLEALRQVGLEIAAQLDLKTLLHSIVARAVELVGGSSGGLYVYRPDRDLLEWIVAIGPGLAPIGSTLQRGQGLSGKVWEMGQPLIVDDYQQWEGRAAVFEEYAFAAIVGVPVLWGDELLGVLDILSDTIGAFSQAHTDLLSLFAAQATLAIVNARLFEGLQHRMAELQSAQAQLVQSAKMAAVGELAAGVAHELNNPLTSVLGFAELAMRSVSPDDPLHGDLATVVAEARRARDVVRNLLAFSRQGESFFERTDANQVVQETLALIRQQIEKSGVILREQYATDLPLLSLANTRMKQVFLNLFTNALHAMPQGGMLTVFSERVGNEVAIHVTDTGVGISPEDMPHLFDPFFTTKSAPLGSGLGLSISLSIVQEQGGRLEVKSRLGEGSTFTVWLPVKAAPEEVGHGR